MMLDSACMHVFLGRHRLSVPAGTVGSANKVKLCLQAQSFLETWIERACGHGHGWVCKEG